MGDIIKAQMSKNGMLSGCFRPFCPLSCRYWNSLTFATTAVHMHPFVHYHHGWEPDDVMSDNPNGSTWASALQLLLTSFSCTLLPESGFPDHTPMTLLISNCSLFSSAHSSEPFVIWSTTLHKHINFMFLPWNAFYSSRTYLFRKVQTYVSISEFAHRSPDMASLCPHQVLCGAIPPTQIHSLSTLKNLSETSLQNAFSFLLHCIISTWWYTFFSNYLYQVMTP